MPDPEPNFTPDDILKSIFDPVLRREVEDYAKEKGWDKNPPTIDLRTVPREKWTEYLGWAVALPPDIAAYLDGEQRKLTVPEIDNIEEALDKLYGTLPDYTILESRGRFYLEPVK